MSNVSTTHNIAKLDKSSKALTGQRMSRVIAKAASKAADGWIKTEAGYYHPNLTESKFVSLPRLNAADITSEQLTKMMPHIIGILEGAQDSIIKDRILDAAVTSINDSEIGVDSCIAHLDSNSGSDRITSEYLVEWFSDTYKLQAAEYIGAAMKFGEMDGWTEDQATVVEQKINVLAGMFAGYAGARYSPDIPRCKAMLKFAEFVGADNHDARMTAYVTKTARIKAEKEAELNSDALGF